MKSFAVVCLLVVGASANYYGQMSAPVASAPATYETPTLVRKEPVIPILSYEQSLTGGLSDSHKFTSGNGIQQSESTQVVAGNGALYDDGTGKLEKSDSSLAKSGSVSYTSPEGVPITLSYTAGEDGFKPTGSHLPVAPAPLPVPQELADAYTKSASDFAAAAALAAAAPDMPETYNSYEAPARVAPVQSYSAPAPLPVVRMQTYSAPAPAPLAPQPEIRIVHSGY